MIYGFRGADINSFFYFVDEFKLKKFELGRNYRSTQTIVDAAASLIAHNEHQFSKHIFSKKEKGTKIVSYTMNNQKQEALRVVQIIKAMQKRGVKLSEMAILYRMSFLSRNVEDALISNNIPYRMVSGTPFYARKEIKDILAFLRFALNPNDQVSLIRALSRPKKGLGEVSINKINTCLYGENGGIMSVKDLDELCKVTPLKGKSKNSFLKFVEIIKIIKEDIDNNVSPSDIILKTMNLTDYLKFLKEEDPNSFEDRQKNISELLNIATNYESVEEFVNNMVLNEEDVDENGDAAERVNMMTIHGSKGGEWKVVILVGCNQGIIPHFKASREEERRLMYVAITRAKEYMFLTRSKTAMIKGKFLPQEPSEFLTEIDKKYINFA